MPHRVIAQTATVRLIRDTYIECGMYHVLVQGQDAQSFWQLDDAMTAYAMAI